MLTFANLRLAFVSNSSKKVKCLHVYSLTSGHGAGVQDAAVLALAAGALRTRVWPRVAGARGRGRGLQHQLEPGRARVTRPLELHGHRACRAHRVAAT